MATKPVLKAVPKAKKIDSEKKGKKLSKNKTTTIGNSRNSHATNKRAVRERKRR